MITGMFCYRLRPDIDMDEYQAEVFRMYERVTGNPDFGFVGLNTFTSDNGENVLIAEFESLEGLEAWRNDPEHLTTQERGRTEWFESYWIAELIPRASFDRIAGRRIPDSAVTP